MRSITKVQFGQEEGDEQRTDGYTTEGDTDHSSVGDFILKRHSGRLASQTALRWALS